MNNNKPDSKFDKEIQDLFNSLNLDDVSVVQKQSDNSSESKPEETVEQTENKTIAEPEQTEVRNAVQKSRETNSVDLQNNKKLPDAREQDRLKKHKKTTFKEAFVQSTNSPIKKVCFSFVAAFCVIVLLTLVIFAVMPKKTTSEQENRSLQTMPVLSLSRLTSGAFMDEFENFLSDQFPLRNFLMSCKTVADRIVGKTKINDVYVGKDGYLFKEPSTFDKTATKKLISSINAFAKNNKDASVILSVVPDSSCINAEYLPFGFTPDDEKSQLKFIKSKADADVKFVDSTKKFESLKDKQQLYYRTDHHWTTRAAYETFKLICKTWDIDIKDAKYKFYTVSDSFRGTLASSSGINSSSDIIEICAPKNVTYYVDYEEAGEKKASLFDEEKLDEKNQYEVFLGGNYGKVIVTTANETNRTLLLFKDSYANCLIPMLLPHFDKIIVVDPRYYNGSISDITGEYSFTHALFLYSMNTFLDNGSLTSLLNDK